MRSASVIPSAASATEFGRSFGILSTFPPTACGIATFSAALAGGLIANGDSVDVVRLGARPDVEDPLVLGALPGAGLEGVVEGIEVLNRADVAIIQHEYGLYDGLDGAAVLDLLHGITVPTIVVAHTVVDDPTPNQRFVLERLCAAAGVVVVMTSTARRRLLDRFDVDAAKVVLIPHGASTPVDVGAGEPERSPDERRLLTWGLLGPGKGIEWAIDAVAQLSDLQPRPHYVVAGMTHPKVRARSGESYREMLQRRAAGSAAGPMVSFDDNYRDLASLTELIRSADLVVLPYDSKEQVTSGVLVDAVAAGRPVVATAFPHAVELLGSGAGLVVPQQDVASLVSAIRSVLTDDDLLAAMAAEARRLAPDLAWTAVAGQYAGLADRLLVPHQALSA